MLTFVQMMNLLMDLQKNLPGAMEWDVNSNGVLTVKTYVGMENYDLAKQARAMFEPVD